MDLESEDYRKAQNVDGIGLCLLDTRQEFVLFLPLRRETAFSGESVITHDEEYFVPPAAKKS